MITRREAVSYLAGSLLCAGVETSAEEQTQAIHEPVSLPGKAALIKHTFRPPNYETPLSSLRSEFTANDRFFVRYHLANVPEVDRRAWRLRIGGESAVVRIPRDREQGFHGMVNAKSTVT